MNSKVISFQIVQGYSGSGRAWTPDVVVLCEDGSMWCMGLQDFQRGYGSYEGWKRMTPEPTPTQYGNYNNLHNYTTT
jgi:hypothetical protein